MSKTGDDSTTRRILNEDSRRTNPLPPIIRTSGIARDVNKNLIYDEQIFESLRPSADGIPNKLSVVFNAQIYVATARPDA
ncbi:MAG: hypothetical protein Q9218_002555 [Villophora microphyllina]